jgi:hypothetical protein
MYCLLTAKTVGITFFLLKSYKTTRTTQRELPLVGGSLCAFRAAVFERRQLAPKARYLLWAKCLSAAGGR